MNNNFLTRDNLDLIIRVLRDYIHEKHDYDLEKNETFSATKKTVFEAIRYVDANKRGTETLKDLNSNVVRLLYQRKYRPEIENFLKNRKTVGSILERDQDTYQNRPTYYNTIIPQADDYKPHNQGSKDQEINRYLAERDVGVVSRKPDIDPHVVRPQEVKPQEQEEFLEKLKVLEIDRAKITNDLESNMPKEKVNFNNKTDLQESSAPVPRDNTTLFTRDDTIIKPITNKIAIEKYIDINSGNRDLMQNNSRFRYSIDFSQFNQNSVQYRYKNVDSIEITHVILPQDTVSGVFDDTANSTQPYRPFRYQFQLNTPYVYLVIDEFTDNYDGTNDIIRRSFSKMVVDRTFATIENGRTYTVLKSLQKEIKKFFPTPLTSLNRFTIGIYRSNGSLVNDSSDGYQINTINYDTNFPNYLEITMNSYFDANEFATNDEIMITGFEMTRSQPNLNPNDIAYFNEFINRQNGHLVCDTGGKNSMSFYNIIYILIPSDFDAINGSYTPRNSIISLVTSYNTGSYANSGLILNSSLQNTVGFRIKILQEDAREIFSQTRG